jgi:hypothetical protein
MGTVPDGLIEKLADAEHASWARWMDYLFSKCHSYDEGSALIPSLLVERWMRQAATPYAKLAEAEKQSDRKEVAVIVPLILEWARTESDAALALRTCVRAFGLFVNQVGNGDVRWADVEIAQKAVDAARVALPEG